jgi:7-keto-8-aminopelargonate synthetase-like enzyme
MLDLAVADGQAGADPRRLAALTLHAMAQQDRQWVLGRLAQHERQHLESLLVELIELGFPQDPALVQIAIERSRERGAEPREEASALELARTLLCEPLPVVQTCLAVYDSEQAQAVAQQLSVKGVRTVDLQVPTLPESATALREAIRAELAQRVAERRRVGVAAR